MDTTKNFENHGSCVFLISCCYLVVKKRERERGGWYQGKGFGLSRVKEGINSPLPPQAQLGPILLVPDTQRREREKMKMKGSEIEMKVGEKRGER